MSFTGPHSILIFGIMCIFNKGGSLTILLLVSLVRLSRIREFKQPSNRVRCHIANLNYARLQGTQSYRLSQKMAPPQGFEPRNVGIKIRCLRPTWRRGYFVFNKETPCTHYINVSMLQFLVYVFLMIDANSYESPKIWRRFLSF